MNSKKKCGLVLEGGGHRGIFTAGVLDVLLENNIFVDGVIGVSAGAIHAVNYISRQKGRSVRYTSRYCNDKRYMSLKSLITTGDLFNAEFCYHTLPEKIDIFDNETFEASSIEYYVVCTNVEDGKPFIKKLSSLKEKNMNWLQASASMPLVSKPVLCEDENGKMYQMLDGGISDSIPEEAFRNLGYEKNIVILTQPKEYTKKKNSLLPLMKLFFRKNPSLLKTMAERHTVYNKTLNDLEQKEKEGSVLIIRPEVSLSASRTEKDSEKIIETYNEGRKAGEKYLDKIKQFLQ